MLFLILSLIIIAISSIPLLSALLERDIFNDERQMRRDVYSGGIFLKAGVNLVPFYFFC